MTVPKKDRKVKFIEGQRAESSDSDRWFQPFFQGFNYAADRTGAVFPELQRNGQGNQEGHSRRAQGPGETH